QNWIFRVDTLDNSTNISYLQGPCFDFSSYSIDPKIAFQLFLNTDDEASQFWLEVSTDNGQNWRKVVTNEAAFNWYNTPNEAAWTNVFGKGIWQYVETPLQNVAGQAQTRFRCVFEKGGEETIGPKVAIDDVHLFLPTNENVVALAAQNTATNSCGIRTDGVQLELYNASDIVVSGVTVYYQINNDKPVVEVADTLVLAPNERQTYTFEQTFSSSKAGTYTIKTWVQSSGETVPLSDTTYYQFSVTPPLDVPFVEDFEDRVIDPGWFAVGNVEVTLRGPGDHNNESHIMAANLWSSANRTAIHSARYGVISEGDSLSFDYRLVLWENATLPLTMNGDSILIEVSTDCGQSFSPIYSIQADNHITTAEFQRVNLDLSAFAGNNINFRFVCVWGNGDYWLDFDNISILPGLMTSAVNLNLASDFQVFPNPTSGQATVKVMLLELRPVSLQVLNQLGQVVYRKEVSNQRVIQEVIDLQRQTAGIYFVQFLVGNQVFSRKLLLAK
ncbi:MAG: T9SS type A sorting domain-containing protein, partial [Bacteroidota bacterium]